MRLVNYVLLASTSAILVQSFDKPEYCRLKKHNQGQISTFLWRIKKQPPSYFFGTIHVPYTEVWEYVSRSARRAFSKSNTIFLELDLNNPRTLRTLAMCQLLPKGEHLKSHLPSDVYEKLEMRIQFLKSNLLRWLQSNEPGHPTSYAEHIFKSIAGNWERKRPVYIMLMLNSLNLEGIKNRGVPVLDLYLAQEATASSKPLGAIENALEQCQPLNSLNKTHIIYILNETLSRPASVDTFSSNFESTTREMIEHYNCGSLDERIFTRDSIQVSDELLQEENFLSSSHSSIMSGINAYFRHEIIMKRNLRMAERVVRVMEAHPEKSFFFAFGAGHFLGENSVISLVRKAGYKIASVKPKHRSEKRKERKNRHQGKGRSRQAGKTRQDGSATNSRRVPVDQVSAFRRPGTTAQPTKRRNFNELWVRMKGYTPKPWRDMQILSALKQQPVKQHPTNYFLVQYNSQKHCDNCSSAGGYSNSRFSRVTFVQISLLMLVICKFL